ncbi:MAG: hypothetical protein ACRCWR_07065, partial [Saezia sp.]
MAEDTGYPKKLIQLLICLLLIVLGIFLYMSSSNLVQQKENALLFEYCGIVMMVLGVIPVLLLWRDAEKEAHQLPLRMVAYVSNIFVFAPLRIVLGITCFVLAFFMMSKGIRGSGSKGGLGGIFIGLIFYLLFLAAAF